MQMPRLHEMPWQQSTLGKATEDKRHPVSQSTILEPQTGNHNMVKTRLKKHKPPKQTSDFFAIYSGPQILSLKNDQAIQIYGQNKYYFTRLYEN